MRVLYVVHQFYPKFVSGTEQYVLALAQAGRRRGDDVRVFTVDPDFRDNDPPEEIRSYRYLEVPVLLYRFDKDAIRNHVLTDYHNPAVGPIFRRLLEDFQPAVVHFFHFRWLGLDRLEEASAMGIPAVVHLMDFWFACPNFLLLRPGDVLCDGPPDQGLGCFDCVHQGIATWAREPWARERNQKKLAAREEPEHDPSGAEAGYAMMRRPDVLAAALARAERVIAPSRTVQEVLDRAGARSPRTVHRPYCIDWDLLSELPEAVAPPITVGFMGTLAPHKGVDVLLRAFSSIEDPELRLRIHGRFGDFPEFDAQLMEMAKADPRIEFRGPFARAELGKVLGALHLLVVPSRWRENTPFVCLEARAAGVPVVASDLPGMSEAIPDERGRRFRVGDAEDLARVLREEIQKARERGGRRLAPDRTIPTIAAQYEDFRGIYTQVLHEKLGQQMRDHPS